MTPYMAQGAAMAVEDAAVLSRCLEGVERDVKISRIKEQIAEAKQKALEAGGRDKSMMIHMPAGIPALMAEVASAVRLLETPAFGSGAAYADELNGVVPKGYFGVRRTIFEEYIESGTWTAIWSPSKSALNAVQTSG